MCALAFEPVCKQQVLKMEVFGWLMVFAMCCALAVPLLCSYRVTQKDNGAFAVCARTFVGDEDSNEFVHDTNTWYD